MKKQIEKILALMESGYYIADREIATALHLAIVLEKPLLVEGHAGVGKTEIAKVLAQTLGTDLIRLQCYEGLDASTALYEWNYSKQMLRIKLSERSGQETAQREQEIFSEPFLLKRPLLQAITHNGDRPVLLIDEIDRSDEEFESFLLEVLSDFQVTIPELGTIRATHRPYVILTSNRFRDLSDALRRRCLYLWIDYPSFEKELRIVETKVPDINERLAAQICRFMQEARRLHLAKVPGIAETLDWALALVSLHRDALDPEIVRETLGCLFKDVEDLTQVKTEALPGLLAAASK